MTTITSYIDGFDALVSSLNEGDAAGAKSCLAKLPKKPTVSTWQAHKLVARAAAKHHLNKPLASAFEDLQYKFYLRCNLNDITPELIREHLELDIQGERDYRAEQKRLKEEAEANEKLRRRAEALQGVF